MRAAGGLAALLVLAVVSCEHEVPTTCTGSGIRECDDGYFCTVVDFDPTTGMCIPIGDYRCLVGTTTQELCDSLRGERSCAICQRFETDEDPITFLDCVAPSECTMAD